ncbi:succinylglutamate desuccinylase/aspartoacylase family protein [Nannocystis sp. SCPEA4]|uniref:succinylglutamate desuccinylase/aspartoacylase family protein n=1 Tax=Nannocystis sp. SCPEA4 TaxID=2996787 RepID=UPI00226FA71B|nr:succinylglutamate desuccinylase/aspartoacylase family protein [Nannocystis sp. SCPEA4]MCY1062047.1 succinylglutamate desuccinylase/aspartoacylase family protein [Nannocystis sp. SCPEA4]
MTASFALGDVVAKPGELVHGWFELATLPTGHRERLPIIVVHGREPGPVLWITANIHGDEVTGLSVVHAILATDLASRLRGTLVAIPSLNPAGLHARQRVSYLDRRDPNRLFPDFPAEPGHNIDHPAVLESGYARLFAEMRRADFLVDLHCYGLRACCFIIRDRVLYRRPDEHDAATDLAERLNTLCTWTGLPVVNEVPSDRYLEARLHRSVSGTALLQARIPAITVELGLTGAVDPAARHAGIIACNNVLKGAGMVPGELEPMVGIPLPRVDFPVMRDLAPRARATGIVHYLVEPGDVVRVGDRLATLTDIHGRPLPAGGDIRAEVDGWILALPHGVLCYEGEAVVHMAVPDAGPAVELDPAYDDTIL